jgi:hypothetical protein
MESKNQVVDTVELSIPSKLKIGPQFYCIEREQKDIVSKVLPGYRKK